ncbi:hypothetical protein EYF80_026412 [Liparis tanakae]|uniref:Uncharacterized protein n=1 Tax=Liparis tanakae TaxID=230148 RepID=A0A4Z2HD12_9TELE|nr:hypothetical protein EYF80_026412 [Liparis tanakae]
MDSRGRAAQLHSQKALGRPDMSGRRFPAAMGGVGAGDPSTPHWSEAPCGRRLEIGAGDAEEYFTAAEDRSDNKLAFFSRRGLGRRTLGQPSECLPGVPMDPSCPFPFQPTRKRPLCQHLSLRKLVKVMALLAVSVTTGRKERGPASRGIGVEIGERGKEWEREGVKGGGHGKYDVPTSTARLLLMSGDDDDDLKV